MRKTTSNAIISHLADSGDVVIKTHSVRGGNLFTLRRRLAPLPEGICERLISKGVLVGGEADLFGSTDAQSYRLAPDWGGRP